MCLGTKLTVHRMHTYPHRMSKARCTAWAYAHHIIQVALALGRPMAEFLIAECRGLSSVSHTCHGIQHSAKVALQGRRDSKQHIGTIAVSVCAPAQTASTRRSPRPPFATITSLHLAKRTLWVVAPVARPHASYRYLYICCCSLRRARADDVSRIRRRLAFNGRSLVDRGRRLPHSQQA